jgi:hypothetical protein
MSRKMIYRFLSLILIALLFSCKTSQPEIKNNAEALSSVTISSEDPFESLRNKVHGDWIWVKTSCCGRTRQITTPESTQMKLSRNFAEHDSVELYVNDSLQARVFYGFSFGFKNENDTMIIIGKGRPAYLRIENDTMIIDLGYIDLQTEWYVRPQQ